MKASGKNDKYRRKWFATISLNEIKGDHFLIRNTL